MTKGQRKALTWLLQEWGKWRRQDCLGYPHMTAEARMLYSPGRTHRSDHSPHYRPSRDARRAEDAIVQIDPYYQNLLWLKYAQEASEKVIRLYAKVEQKTRGAYRWQVEKAHLELGKVVYK